MMKLKTMTTVIISKWCLNDDDVDVHNDDDVDVQNNDVDDDGDGDFQESFLHIQDHFRGLLLQIASFSNDSIDDEDGGWKGACKLQF